MKHCFLRVVLLSNSMVFDSFKVILFKRLLGALNLVQIDSRNQRNNSSLFVGKQCFNIYRFWHLDDGWQSRIIFLLLLTKILVEFFRGVCGWRKTVETCAKVTSDTKCNQSIDSDLERYTAYMVAVTEVSGASLRYAIQGFLEPLDLVFWSQLALIKSDAKCNWSIDRGL